MTKRFIQALAAAGLLAALISGCTPSTGSQNLLPQVQRTNMDATPPPPGDTGGGMPG